MVNRILYGKELALLIKNTIKDDVLRCRKLGYDPPKLYSILIGNKQDSLRYVSNKQRAAKSVGIDFNLVHLHHEPPNHEIKSIITDICGDNPNGILIQLPLPESVNILHFMKHISPDIDVDGLHPINTGYLAQYGQFKRQNNNTIPFFHIPCTALAVMKLLAYYKINLANKNVVVVGRSNLVGLPLSLLLLHQNAYLNIVHSKIDNIEQYTRNADVLISAVGIPHLISSKFTKSDSILIDIGMSISDNQICGDINVNDIISSGLSCQYTPVPGGIGPLTVAMVLYNTMRNYFYRHNIVANQDFYQINL